MDRIITALQLQKQNKERVNVFLDGEFAFALDLMLAAGLAKGQTLSPAEIEQLQHGDEERRAYASAVYFLGYRPRSRAEVEQNLREKKFSAPAIAAALQRLTDEQYLDDVAFAQYWRENREQFRPRSARALRYELRQKGVETEVIAEALVGLDEAASAWAALEPKLARWQTLAEAAFLQKAMNHLAQRGFAYSVARQAAKRGWTSLGKRASLPEDE